MCSICNGWHYTGYCVCCGSDMRPFPIFPTFYNKPTEDRLEAVVSRLMDKADALLMAGKVTQEAYDLWAKSLDQWTSTVEIVNPYYTAPRAHG